MRKKGYETVTTENSKPKSKDKKEKYRRTPEQRVAALEQALAAARAIEKRAKRKYDTRLKATLGGSLIALARQNPYLAVQTLEHLRSCMNERDRIFTQPVFVQWTSDAKTSDPFQEDLSDQ